MSSSADNETLAGISLKTLLLTLLALLLFGIYIGVVFYGENSLKVWYRLIEKEKQLQQEKQTLLKQNEMLQKRYFVLKQLEPKE